VLRRIGIDGVNQQVGVDEDHLRSRILAASS
jgi:hypothetical protein